MNERLAILGELHATAGKDEVRHTGIGKEGPASVEIQVDVDHVPPRVSELRDDECLVVPGVDAPHQVFAREVSEFCDRHGSPKPLKRSPGVAYRRHLIVTSPMNFAVISFTS